MIHLFKGGGKLLFFPKKWANSIVRWIAGIHSPSGMIKLRNDMNPGDGGSLEIDVDMDAVSAQVLRRVDTRNVTQAERERFSHLLRGMADECSILFSSGHLYVSADWLEAAVKDIVGAMGGGGSGSSEALTVSDIGVTVQAFSQKLQMFADDLASNGKVPLSRVYATANENARLVIAAANQQLGYTTANALLALLALESDYDATANALPYAEWAADAPKASSLVGTDTDGNLKQAVALPTSTTTYDRVLRIAANGTTLAWVNQYAVGKATDPGANVDALTPSVNTSAADSTTWTAGGTNGVVVRRQTRTRRNGTTLYGFYQDETYDRYGRLYSVSAETRYVIDTPTTVTWS